MLTVLRQTPPFELNDDDLSRCSARWKIPAPNVT
jgi:hypothetical protein